MDKQSLENSAKRIISLIRNLRGVNGYYADPYELLYSKYSQLLKFSSGELTTEEKRALMNWSKYIAFRLAYEAPIKDHSWKELLNEIELLNNQLPT